VRVVNVHLRPPLYDLGYQWGVFSPLMTDSVRRNEVEFIINYLSQNKLEPTLILGDFNENDSGGCLSYLTQKDMSVAVSDFFGDLFGVEEKTFLSKLKLGDAVAELVPSDIETHRFPIPNTDMILRSRLDHILYAKNFMLCEYCQVIVGFEEGASDHMPVHAAFSMIPPKVL